MENLAKPLLLYIEAQLSCYTLFESLWHHFYKTLYSDRLSIDLLWFLLFLESLFSVYLYLQIQFKSPLLFYPKCHSLSEIAWLFSWTFLEWIIYLAWDTYQYRPLFNITFKTFFTYTSKGYPILNQPESSKYDTWNIFKSLER